jgi:hypothetical protein
MNFERVVEQAIEEARILGASTAREAAELTLGRRLKGAEWSHFADMWQPIWDRIVGDDLAGSLNRIGKRRGPKERRPL